MDTKEHNKTVKRKRLPQNIQKKFTDKQNELRLFIMNFIIDKKRPFHLEKDSVAALEMLGMDKARYEKAIACLVEKDGMVVDENSNVNFIYPVSALATSHKVTLEDGRTFSAMCAIDAIGTAFTFQQDAEIHSVCAVCGEPVFVKIRDGKVDNYVPSGLHALTFPLGELINWAGSC